MHCCKPLMMMSSPRKLLWLCNCGRYTNVSPGSSVTNSVRNGICSAKIMNAAVLVLLNCVCML